MCSRHFIVTFSPILVYQAADADMIFKALKGGNAAGYVLYKVHKDRFISPSLRKRDSTGYSNRPLTYIEARLASPVRFGKDPVVSISMASDVLRQVLSYIYEDFAAQPKLASLPWSDLEDLLTLANTLGIRTVQLIIETSLR